MIFPCARQFRQNQQTVRPLSDFRLHLAGLFRQPSQDFRNRWVIFLSQ